MAAERRRRPRTALLSAYYGIDDGSGSPKTPPKKQDVLDQEGFDARSYFDGILASDGTAELLKRATEVDKQVRDMDSDLQMVAYENYGKIVRATDTCKQMRTSSEGLAPSLKLVDEGMHRIFSRQSEIDDATSGRAAEVEVLARRQQVASKVRVLLDLPRTLQQCLERGHMRRAVEAYCACAPVLRAHGQLAAFGGALAEAEKLIGVVRAKLDERLGAAEVDPDEAARLAALTSLIDRGESRDLVLREYLKGRTAALRRCLERCCSAGPNSEPTEPAADVVCDALCAEYVPDLVAVMTQTEEMTGRRAATSGSEEEACLNEFVAERLEELFGRVAECFCRSRRTGEEAALTRCVGRLRDSMQYLQSLVPDAFARLFTAFLSQIAAETVQTAFSEASAALCRRLCDLHAACEEAPADQAATDVFEEVGSAERELCKQALVALDACALALAIAADNADFTEPAQLARDIQRELESYLALLPAAAAPRGGTSQEAPRVSAELRRRAELAGLSSLALAALSRRFDEKALAALWADAGKRLRAAPGVAAAFAALGEARPAELSARFQAASEAGLGAYVSHAGAHLARALRDSLARRKRPQAEDAPRSPGDGVKTCLAALRVCDAQLQKLLQDPRKARRQQRVFVRTDFLGRRDEMEMEVERLWARKLQIFAPVPFNRAAAVLAILRCAFKALAEHVREEIFTRVELQQVQLDCALLAVVSAEYTEGEDSSMLDSLLGEAVKSASMCCLDPVPIDGEAIQHFCDEQRRALEI